MQGRRWMEVGHGEGCRVMLTQRKPERKRGWRVRVGEEEEGRPRRKAGKAAEMDGDRTGYLKGKATPRSAPRHPWVPAGAGVGTAEPGAFGGSAGGGMRGWVPRVLSTHPVGMQDVG